jgi:hypothetical protein
MDESAHDICCHMMPHHHKKCNQIKRHGKNPTIDIDCLIDHCNEKEIKCVHVELAI